MLLKVDKTNPTKNCIIEGLKPEMYFAAGVVETICRMEYGVMPVMTSALDNHATGLHPLGYAFDIRTRNLSLALAKQLFQTLDYILNPRGFDIVDEIMTKQHIHIEFQPKGHEAIFTKET